MAAFGQFSKQYFVSQFILDLRLKHPSKGPGPIFRIMTFFGKPFSGSIRQFQRNLFVGELFIEFNDKFIHDFLHDFDRQGVESDNTVEAVPKFRAEKLFNRPLPLCLCIIRGVSEPDGIGTHFPCTGIGSWDVSMTLTFLKSAFRPLLSVNVA